MPSIPLVLELSSGRALNEVTGLAVSSVTHHSYWWLLGAVLAFIIAVLIWRR